MTKRAPEDNEIDNNSMEEDDREEEEEEEKEEEAAKEDKEDEEKRIPTRHVQREATWQHAWWAEERRTGAGTN
jgi:hypothetical protein